MSNKIDSTTFDNKSPALYPASIGTGVALVATVVAGLAIYWICSSNQLSSCANGAYVITASVTEALSASALIIGLVAISRMTFKSMNREKQKSELPVAVDHPVSNDEAEAQPSLEPARAELDTAPVHQPSPEPAEAVLDEGVESDSPSIEPSAESQPILEQNRSLVRRIESFENFMTELLAPLKDGEINAKDLNSKFRTAVVEDMEHIPFHENQVQQINNILGIICLTLTENVNRENLKKVKGYYDWAIRKLGWAVRKGIDSFFKQNALVSLKDKKVHAFLCSNEFIAVLFDFIIWTKKFEDRQLEILEKIINEANELINTETPYHLIMGHMSSKLPQLR